MNCVSPDTAEGESVPLRRPPEGFVPIAIVTAPVNAGVVFPNASRAVSSTAGVIGVATSALLGCTVNASWAGAPGVTVMEGSPDVTGLPFTVAVTELAVPAACPVNVAV